jgi:hypothetical protein
MKRKNMYFCRQLIDTVYLAKTIKVDNNQS